MYDQFDAAVDHWNTTSPAYTRVFFFLKEGYDDTFRGTSEIRFGSPSDPNALAETLLPNNDGSPNNIVFDVNDYTSVQHSTRMDRDAYGNYYEILRHELGHAAGFRHTDESPPNGAYTYIHGSYIGTAQTTNVMHSQPIVPAQLEDGKALRLLYPTHDNDYSPRATDVSIVDNSTARIAVSWTNRSSSLPDHTKVQYDISKSSSGPSFARQTGFTDNTRTRSFVVPRGNIYTICIAGANFREDEVFPSRCISVSTKNMVGDPTGPGPGPGPDPDPRPYNSPN